MYNIRIEWKRIEGVIGSLLIPVGRTTSGVWIVVPAIRGPLERWVVADAQGPISWHKSVRGAKIAATTLIRARKTHSCGLTPWLVS